MTFPERTHPARVTIIGKNQSGCKNVLNNKTGELGGGANQFGISKGSGSLVEGERNCQVIGDIDLKYKF
jgi:hypothetical protein